MFFNRYDSISSLIKILFDIVNTKIFFSNVRLIRWPFYIRGKKFMDFGENLTTGVGCRLDAFPIDHYSKNKVIFFGKNVQINDYVHITAIENVTIGHNVLIASKVFITDHNHGTYSGTIQDHPFSTVLNRKLLSTPVIIGDNVWLGEFVSVMPGVRIGNNSIIGAMSVVTKDIPDNSIAVGSPARVIKIFNFKTEKWEKI